MTVVESHLAVRILVGALVGLPAGAVFFAALKRNVRMYVQGGPAFAAVALHVLRLALVAALFFGLANLGFGALLGGLGGFVLMRWIVTNGGAPA